MPPLTYLLILRMQEMVRLNRLLITITERVGCYHRRGPARTTFRSYMGVTPIDYRRYGPPNASAEGSGISVVRAAKSANESAKQPVGRGIAVELPTG